MEEENKYEENGRSRGNKKLKEGKTIGIEEICYEMINCGAKTDRDIVRTNDTNMKRRKYPRRKKNMNNFINIINSKQYKTLDNNKQTRRI